MKTSDIKGIIPPVITPMNNDPEQTVNHQALREQVERLLAGGVHGIFPMGTNGEAYALSFQEKEEILATVIDQVKGRVPVYAGTGCIMAGSPLVAAAAQAMENHRQGRRLLLGALPQAEMLPARLFRGGGRYLRQRHRSGQLLKLLTPKTSL